ATGTPVYRAQPARPGVFQGRMEEGAIVVTAQRRKDMVMDVPIAMSSIAMEAAEEQLGDLKLYRIPERVDVAAKGLKQVAILNKDAVRGEFIYEYSCDPYDEFHDQMDPANITFATVNDEMHGLGAAMPMGGLTIFEPSSAGDLLIADRDLRDYAVGQDVEITMGQSSMVFSQCAQAAYKDPEDERGKWLEMRTKISNANRHSIAFRMAIGSAGEWDIRSERNKPKLKDGCMVIEYTIPAGKTREYTWKIRRPSV
ncbi:MAG: hypothetical protein WAT93_04565, partial [Pontixanthobacter sp.]